VIRPVFQNGWNEAARALMLRRKFVYVVTIGLVSRERAGSASGPFALGLSLNMRESAAREQRSAVCPSRDSKHNLRCHEMERAETECISPGS